VCLTIFFIGNRLKLEPFSDVEHFVKTDRISDLRENIQAFSYAAGMDSLHGASQRIHNFLVRKGITTGKLNSAELLKDAKGDLVLSEERTMEKNFIAILSSRRRGE
jgi:hypothetical protein